MKNPRCVFCDSQISVKAKAVRISGTKLAHLACYDEALDAMKQNKCANCGQHFLIAPLSEESKYCTSACYKADYYSHGKTNDEAQDLPYRGKPKAETAREARNREREVTKSREDEQAQQAMLATLPPDQQ